MNVKTAAAPAVTRDNTRLQLGNLILVAMLGLGILFVAGHAQSHALHDAAHDLRHSIGFPCH